MAKTLVERVEQLRDDEIVELVEATETAIVDGGGFGWLVPPPQGVLERFWRGVLTQSVQVGRSAAEISSVCNARRLQQRRRILQGLDG